MFVTRLLLVLCWRD